MISFWKLRLAHIVHLCRLLITFANSLEPDQARHKAWPDLVPNCLTLWWYSCKNFSRKFLKNQLTHVRIQNVLSEGVQLFFFLLFFDEGRMDQNTTISRKSWRAIIGTPAKHHLNGLSLGGRWWPYIECWLGSFVIFKGIQTTFAKIPYNFCDFPERVQTPCPPTPLDLRMRQQQKNACKITQSAKS